LISKGLTPAEAVAFLLQLFEEVKISERFNDKPLTVAVRR
jgi:hypothetical protein